MRVLIIDDNPADVNMINETFMEIRGCRYTPTIINNGTDAIKYLLKQAPYTKESSPNLIILDLSLPGRSGYDVLKEMGKKELNIPVIVYTTSDRPEDIAKAYKYKASSYVIKPADLDELNRVLKLIGQFWLTVAKLPEQGA